MTFYLAASLQIQNKRFTLGDGHPQFVPSLPFFKELQVAAEEAVFSHKDALLLDDGEKNKTELFPFMLKCAKYLKLNIKYSSGAESNNT